MRLSFLKAIIFSKSSYLRLSKISDFTKRSFISLKLFYSKKFKISGDPVIVLFIVFTPF